MKKNYLSLIFLMLSLALQSQQLIDFESFNLNVESYDNGSSGNGDFIFGSQSNEISLSNSYDTTWQSWSGYSISNMTDTTTPGYSNQYSSFAGEGFGGSSNYAVGYKTGSISCSNQFESIVSLKITNATYTAISMRDGDQFAKQFGSPLDASGMVDGTNGEDFYRIWLYCEDFSGTYLDSIEVLLADYRFNDNSQDYIVKDWITVDINQQISFPVSKITFTQESSDNGEWGMNTPAYYVIDNIMSDFNLSTTGNENTLNQVSFYPNPFNDILNVKGEEGLLILTNLNGNVILKQNHDFLSTIDMSFLDKGVYIISIINDKGNFSRKIIK
ncbi:MAG: hypothetical protein CL844_02515 [Crocinitomicaceae bacterium]|nr:hypothetical protein [Crocinitomicaceae bacterium]|tara:strand:+ start:76498 stop:77484 length:987 start_codon:yes stop_codon:yes gene_type:complete